MRCIIDEFYKDKSTNEIYPDFKKVLDTFNLEVKTCDCAWTLDLKEINMDGVKTIPYRARYIDINIEELFLIAKMFITMEINTNTDSLDGANAISLSLNNDKFFNWKDEE